MAATILLTAAGKFLAISPLIPAISNAQTSPQTQSRLTVSASSSVAQGAIVALVGSSQIIVPAALDYSTDGGTTWLPVTEYGAKPDGSWTAKGPTATSAGPLTITVRDHSHPSTTASVSLTVV